MANLGRIKEYSSLLVLLIKLQDWIIICGSGVICFFVLQPYKFFPTHTSFMPPSYVTALSLAFVFSAWWFPSFNVYRSWRGESIYEEIKILLFSWICTMTGLLVFMVFTKTSIAFSRHWLGLWFLSAFLGLVLSRIILRLVLRRLREKGFNRRHIVLVGSGSLSQQIAQKIISSKWMGLNIVGYFSDSDEAILHFKKLGALADLAQFAENNPIDQVWITLPLKDMDKIEALCHQLHSVAVELVMVPDIFSLRILNHSVTQIDGIPVINMSVSPLKSGNAILKWLEDKLLSLCILILISPLLLLIAITIKLTSKGPVLYKQERVSWNGKRFNILKFRTMEVNADQQHGQPVWGGARSKQSNRVGRFLRRYNLDELPQFINVLKGDMSIVGPRPERSIFVEQFKYDIDSYMQKHLVKAGITGWAQINGWRGDTCLKTRLEYDLFYIDHWSLWFDIKIILLTLYKGFMDKNAY